MGADTERTPSEWLRQGLASAWRTTKTIYWANSVSWRFLKAGALLFLGFFLWAGTNVVLSVRPGWTPLQYAMAYGFLVLVYGPIHHLVVIPLALRLRQSTGTRQQVGRHLANAGLVVFLALIVVLGTFPPGAMTVDFTSTLESTGADVDPDLVCVKSTGGNGTVIHCHLTESEGVDRVEVTSGGETVLVDGDPPFEFTVRAEELTSVVGEKRFRVVLRDVEGDLVRRYTRRVSLIDEG